MNTVLYISDFQNSKNMDISINQFGDAQLDAGWHSGELSVCPFNRLYLIEEGEVRVTTGEKTVTMLPGNAYLIPVDLHAVLDCTVSSKKLYFHFNLFRADRYDFMRNIGEIWSMPIEPKLIQALRAHGQGNSVGDILSVRLLLCQLLIRIQDRYGFSQKPVPVYSPTVTNAISYIRKHLTASMTLDDVAKHCLVSKSLLSAAFRREVGLSIGKYIDEQLILIAQWQLANTSYTLQEISHILGYANPSYFSRRFKQLCGMTPLEYREYAPL